MTSSTARRFRPPRPSLRARRFRPPGPRAASRAPGAERHPPGRGLPSRPGGAPDGTPRRLRPHRDDVLVALGGLAGGLLLWRFGLVNNRPGADAHAGGNLVLLPLAAMCLAALGRRAAQPWALALATAAFVADLATGQLLATTVLFTDVVYAAVLYGSPRLSRRLIPVSAAVTVAALIGIPAWLRTPESLLLGVLVGGVTLMPAWTGAMIRDHRNAAAAERLRAEQTALLAEIDRAQAVTAERARMARELHDVVANHLSAIAIHATAALSIDGADGGPVRQEALGVIRENSVRGLAEMRHLIGLLRDPEAGAGDPGDAAASLTAPGLSGLDALLARNADAAAEAGLRLVLRDRSGPGALPVPVELAAYRVVQESVTNALKHAAPGTVTVTLTGPGPGPGAARTRTAPAAEDLPRGEERPAALTVSVVSPLPAGAAGPADTRPRAPGSGAGLIGMRERAELLGGHLAAGPVPRSAIMEADGPDTEGDDGGMTYWRVHAEFPVRAAPGAGEGAA